MALGRTEFEGFVEGPDLEIRKTTQKMAIAVPRRSLIEYHLNLHCRGSPHANFDEIAARNEQLEAEKRTRERLDQIEQQLAWLKHQLFSESPSDVPWSILRIQSNLFASLGTTVPKPPAETQANQRRAPSARSPDRTPSPMKDCASTPMSQSKSSTVPPPS
ncbi:MAG: hypothetical protein U5R48_02900 [Gammaproteobacteria bacterium]|nr:hypothetical protein [Gammaproteobacteria bacterium]